MVIKTFNYLVTYIYIFFVLCPLVQEARIPYTICGYGSRVLSTMMARMMVVIMAVGLRARI